MIRLSELFDQVRSIRTDLLPEHFSKALAEAAIKLSRDTDLLRDLVYFTFQAGEYSASLGLSNGRQVETVFKVERYDDDLGRWVKLNGLCVYRPAGEDIEDFDTAVPTDWGALNGTVQISAPADATTAMRAKVSWSPGRSPVPEELDFPPRAEEALIAWARHIVLETAGPGQNLQASLMEKSIYRAKVSGLCAISQDGEGANRSLNDFLPFE
jgi:hypothetical protein